MYAPDGALSVRTVAGGEWGSGKFANGSLPGFDASAWHMISFALHDIGGNRATIYHVSLDGELLGRFRGPFGFISRREISLVCLPLRAVEDRANPL